MSRIVAMIGMLVGFGRRIFGSLFFLLFFGMGLLFCVLIAREVYRDAKMYSWPKAECVIIQSGVREEPKSEQPYRFQVRYDYQWQGRTYTGTRWSRQEAGYSDYSGAQRLVSKYGADSKAECFVNPENPTEAVLKRPGLWLGILIFIPLIFIGIGAVGFVAMWSRGGTTRPLTPVLSSDGGEGEEPPMWSVRTWSQVFPAKAETTKSANPKSGLLSPTLSSKGGEGDASVAVRGVRGPSELFKFEV
jgi:uncharacterized protein DUF3592